jgi:CHAT domain-containing protein/tetratricopeptide (TPR) repeat protein
MGAGVCTRIVAILGALGVVVTPPPLAAIGGSSAGTSQRAAQDDMATARELLEAGRYAAAEALLGPLVATQSVNGRETGAALETTDLWVEARVKGGKGALPETLAAAEQTVRSRERLGDRLGLSKALHNLGLTFEERGESGRAVEAHRRAVSVMRSATTTSPASRAAGLAQLARALIGQERFSDAQKALDEARSTIPTPGAAEAAELALLEALLHRSDGDYETAATLLDDVGPRIIAARPEHPDTIAVLQLEGDLLFLRGRDVASTRAKWAAALALSEKTLGADHVHVAVILRRLALASKYAGDLTHARELLDRALAIMERVGAPCQRDLPELLNDFALALASAFDYREARRRYDQALDRSTVCLGRDHSMTATVVHNQAVLARDMGDFALAERLLRRAVADWSKGLGRTHPYVARGLDDLAEVLVAAGRRREASRLLESALTLRRQALGSNHPDVAFTLVKLAELAAKSGSAKLASQRLRQVLEIYDGGGVPFDPDYLAKALQLRASLSAGRGELEAARKDYGEVATIRARIFGASHPLTAAARSDVAAADFAMGSEQSALDGALHAEAEGRNLLQMTARFLPGRQALLYADQRPRGLGLALTIVSSRRIEEVPRVLDAVIRSRGLVLDELAARSQWTALAAPDRSALQSSVGARQARYANLMLRSVQGEVIPRTLLEEAQHQAEEAERELAEQSGDSRDAMARSKAGVEEVRQALPPGAALVSFVRYDRTQISTVKGRSATTTRSWYLAFVTSAGAAPVVVSLGSASAIESAVTAWRNEFSGAAIISGRADPAAALRAYRVVGERLRRLVWDPLTAHLSGASTVFVVPDGALNLVSFPSLPTGTTRYLVETGPVLHLLTTERDLLRGGAASPGRGLLAVGGASYNAAPGSSVGPSMRGTDGGCDRVALQFDDLPGARNEVADIARLWSARLEKGTTPGRDELTVLNGRAASKAAVLKLAAGRRVLHFATHGFFLGSECRPAAANTRSVGGLVSTAPTTAGPATARPAVTSQQSRNPLLISGLAFAGANRRGFVGAERDAGILTAEEVASLDLHGTEWAVLSACETGLGEIKTGEGVVGLRRAFQIAGVRTVIMSLWSVEDQATRTWMRALYQERFQNGVSTAEAVRNASVRMLRDRRARGQSAHPFYWAAFVAAGDWT